jgi:diaminohydroxyphosphoribosylaminopyrimidine deaminase / 5-amino-6-(5-phosphoribosylamino)uracil reductase
VIGEGLLLAVKAINLVNPNPRVGCVLVCNQSIAQGHTQPRGHAHAEVKALQDAAAKGISVKGATAYVTLEPCSHFGRTPPCCHALIDAGIVKVVIAILDPNPLVAGRGVQMLRDAGIEVDVLPTNSAEAIASRELNIGFFSRMIRKTPWVRLKVAASLDGQTALANGASQWITCATARADGHAWRARACAVLTGIGTVLQDDPLLDVRHVDTPRQPHLVIVDSQMDTPLTAKLWSTLGISSIKTGDSKTAGHTAGNTTLIRAGHVSEATSTVKELDFGLSAEVIASIPGRSIIIYAAVHNAAKQQALEALGATVVVLPEANSPKVDLRAMMLDLGQREINELHVEAGFKLNGSLMKAGVVDELLVYTAPKLLGPGLGMANTPALAALAEAVQLQFKSAEMVGEDLRIVARVQGRDQF